MGGTLGPAGTIAAAVVAVAVVAALWPALLGGAHPLAVSPAEALLPPGPGRPFGTDESGRDVLARVVAGTRASLLVGVVATLVGGVTGVLLGVLAGLGGRVVDAVVGRVTEVAFALPLLLVALVVIAVTGPGPVPAMLAVGFATAPGYARIVRGAGPDRAGVAGGRDRRAPRPLPPPRSCSATCCPPPSGRSSPSARSASVRRWCGHRP
ncbi:ABC transporter permease subunit [Curtobacterium sp. MCJR17_043]|uniref:ABC transporter permease subunit n=1 Tax=Curtobacterium sp. MCJR17_043 TaxID=2175660 RepID=UPI0032E91C1A